VQRVQGGLDNGTGFGEVDDGSGSREIFDGKFWEPDSMSESLQELGFAFSTQWFIYRRTIVATGIGDVSRVVATENHSSDGRMSSPAHC
jgi:hypothetical protein